jgi:cytochrome c-type biogenesis protein CcmH/NrfG
MGDLLLEQKRPAEALVAYQRSMELYPGRFNSLLGAARAARTLGDEPLARTFYQELLEVTDAGGRQAALQEAHDYVAPRR